ncbi:hypothetical protein [Vibrio alginolyticus]|uniref:hypothetical protein n=1 Tax=Vibrio TaxID=662 RepID=UPI0006CA94AC|nr:hypothetical protein [Vibrio alginolyticus]KPM98592.1 hypothetical protein AOG25_09150 [Vibrio alginolyticus]CAH7158044.1 Flagellar hook-associated protein flgL [Vibrio chagasii]CAH7327548.1 Flagellar hook-associated protein flgL [Vibrio chagasii]
MGNHFNAIAHQMDHSQYRVKQASDDPIAQGRIITLKQNISDLEGFQTSSDVLKTKLGEIEGNLNAFNDGFKEADNILNKVSSGTMNAQDIQQMGKQLGTLADDLASVLNSQNLNGDFVFSGTAVDQAPFKKEKVMVDIDGVPTELEVYKYQGNNDSQTSKVGNTLSLSSTFDGSRVVTGEDGADFFETLAVAQHYFEKGKGLPTDVQTKVEKDMGSLLQSTIQVQSEIGIYYKQAERNSDVYANMISEYKTLLSETQDADYVQVVTEIQKHEQIMKSLASTSKVMLDMAALRIR